MRLSRAAPWLLAVLLAALAGPGCAPASHRQQAYVFGTLVEITIHGQPQDTARQAADRILREFDHLHRQLHAWQPGALQDLNQALARATPQQPVRVPLPAGLAPLLIDAQSWAMRSDGLFEPAIGNLVRLWGFHADTYAARLPDPAAIAHLVQARPRIAELRIEADHLVADNPALRIDLGGYAKGYALDRAAATLRELGIEHALINIGGNVLALGQNRGRPWRVGIQHPRRAGALAVLELRDGEAVGTSGDYQRFFEHAGRRYSHLIDPRTGWPAQTTQAVTVVVGGAHAGTRSDVTTKPLFIAGPQHWPHMAQRLGVREVLFVAADGSVSVTRALHPRLRWSDPAPPVQVLE